LYWLRSSLSAKTDGLSICCNGSNRQIYGDAWPLIREASTVPNPWHNGIVTANGDNNNNEQQQIHERIDK